MKNIKNLKKSLLPLSLMLAFAGASHTAQAAEYNQVQPKDSKITFNYQQMGVGMEGVFNTFSGQLKFDPDAPEQAQATLEVDLSSVDVDNDEANDELATKTWFNTSAFPVAKFASTGVKALADGQYEVQGQLSIKGQTQDVVVPASFSEQGGQGIFEGKLTIQRGAFSIGEGAWKAFDIVANDVVVNFRLAATSK